MAVKPESGREFKLGQVTSQMAERLKAYQRKQTRIVKVFIIAERD